VDVTRVRDVAEGGLAGHDFGGALQVEAGDGPDVSGLSGPDGQPVLFHRTRCYGLGEGRPRLLPLDNRDKAEARKSRLGGRIGSVLGP
jgi:hypothetical protein